LQHSMCIVHCTVAVVGVGIAESCYYWGRRYRQLLL